MLSNQGIGQSQDRLVINNHEQKNNDMAINLNFFHRIALIFLFLKYFTSLLLFNKVCHACH